MERGVPGGGSAYVALSQTEYCTIKPRQDDQHWIHSEHLDERKVAVLYGMAKNLSLANTLQQCPLMCSFYGNCVASVPFSTFMCLWVIYIFPGSVHIFFLRQNRRIHRANIKIAHRHKNVEIGTVTAQFLFWKYLFPIFGNGSLQCRARTLWRSICLI